MTVFTNCASSTLSHAHLLLLRLPILSMHFSPLDLIIALLFTRDSRLVYWGAWTGSCVPALLAAYQNLVTSVDICVTFSTGSNLNSGSISALVKGSLLCPAPAYVCELCCPILWSIGSRSLCSSEQGFLG